MRTSFHLSIKTLRVYLTAVAVLTVNCTTGSEPLGPRTVVGGYDLTLANGFLVPHEPFVNGTLIVNADSTYTLSLNGSLSQSGRWNAEGKSFTLKATSGDCARFFALEPGKMPKWCIWAGYLETEAIRLLPDDAHTNWFVFHERRTG